MGPIFKNSVHGGSQKILREVAIFLGKSGHEVEVLCTSRPDNFEEFYLDQNVKICPILRFKPYYPSSYYTYPYNLSTTITIILGRLKWADCFYVHDSQLNFPFLTNLTPTITSVRDYLYPETLIGSMNFDGDRIIVNSEYIKECVLSTIGTYRNNIENRLFVIPNGINQEHFKYTNPSRLKSSLGINDEFVILFPHRPEPTKGIEFCLHVIQELKNKGLKIKFVINRYVDKTEQVASYYKMVDELADKLCISSVILYNEWVDYDLMPEYYSMGDVVMVMGSFVEAFGSNTILESICCNCLPIASRVGAIRSTLPDEVLKKYNPGDIENVVHDLEFMILNGIEYDYDKARSYILKSFNFEKMLRTYESVIKETQKQHPLSLIYEVDSIENYKLTPWCFISDKVLYHDYVGDYINLSADVINFLSSSPNFSLTSWKNFNLGIKELDELIELGVVQYEVK